MLQSADSPGYPGAQEAFYHNRCCFVFPDACYRHPDTAKVSTNMILSAKINCIKDVFYYDLKKVTDFIDLVSDAANVGFE